MFIFSSDVRLRSTAQCIVESLLYSYFCFSDPKLYILKKVKHRGILQNNGGMVWSKRPELYSFHL